MLRLSRCCGGRSLFAGSVCTAYSGPQDSATSAPRTRPHRPPGLGHIGPQDSATSAPGLGHNGPRTGHNGQVHPVLIGMLREHLESKGEVLEGERTLPV